jgi:hypothetical protein
MANASDNAFDLLLPEYEATADEVPAGALEELLSPGFGADAVPGGERARGLLAYFPLLRELVRLGEVDFVTRFSVIGELASSERTRYSHEELHAHFPWLRVEERTRIFRGLRASGWLLLDDGSYCLTDRGESVYSLFSTLLGSAPVEGDLALGVFSVEMADEIGVDKSAPLRHLLHNLRKVIGEAELAMLSHSEVKILEVRDKLDRNLLWSRRARESLDLLDVEDFEAYKTAQAIGRSLSELHQWHGALQRALNDIAKRRIHLDQSGLSMTDITQFLIRCDVETLADFGRKFVSTPIEPMFAIADNMLTEAEFVLFLLEREEAPERRGWTDGGPRESEESAEKESRFAGLQRFVEDLERVLQAGEPVKLSDFVPRGGWAESAYRLSLLAMTEGTLSFPEKGGDALIQRLRALPTVVEAEARGERIFKDGVSEISVGRVLPRAAQGQPVEGDG